MSRGQTNTTKKDGKTKMKKTVSTLGKIHKYINQYTVAVDVNNKVECTIYGVDYIVTREGRKYTLYIGDMNNQVFVSTTQKAMVEELDRLISSKKNTKKATKKVAKKTSKRTKKTNKDIISKYIAKENYVIGCWDKKMEKLSPQAIKKVLYWALEDDYMDIEVFINRKPYVVEMATVDNEKDFKLTSKRNYIAQYDNEFYEEW